MLSKRLESVLSSAVKEVKRRNHEYLTLEHLLYAILLEESGRDIMVNCGVNVIRLKHQLERFFIDHMEILPDDTPSEVVQTLGVQRVLQRAILQIQSAGKDKVRVGDVLAALFEEEDSYAVYFLKSHGVTRLDVLDYISHGGGKPDTPDSWSAPGGPIPAREVGEPERPVREGDSMLDQFTTDLTERARKGEIDPLIGRDNEIQRAVQVLSRRRKNNPLFVGDPGVGKTAMAEGLALRIVAGEVPQEFLETRIFALDMGSMLAGTKYRGDLRGPDEGRDQGVVRHPRGHPLRRRNSHHRGRGSHHGRNNGCLQHLKARAAVRTDALHRLHHLRGIQEPLREGPRAVAPVPEDRRARAHGGRDRGHPEGPGPAL